MEKITSTKYALYRLFESITYVNAELRSSINLLF